MTPVGTADLVAFGVSTESAVAGTVTWDRDQACGTGAGKGDFPFSPLDGSPPCVTATLQINGVDYDGFDPELSRLMLFSDGLVVQLWFDPPADLDGAAGADLRLAELGLWHPAARSGDPVFPDVGMLPADLNFVGRLTDRSLVLSAPTCFDPEAPCIQSGTRTLSVVPEASTATLLGIGLFAAGLSARRQRRR